MRGKDFNSVKPYVYWIKNNITEGLTVQIKLKEIYTWLDDY